VSKTILITGATAGFGRACAVRLVHDGHRVIATGRRRERLESLADELGPAVLIVGLDVTNAAAVEALPQMLPEEWRQVDVLVNNAGLALGMGPAQDAQMRDWETMIATNVTGLARMTYRQSGQHRRRACLSGRAYLWRLQGVRDAVQQ
jgi:3-hydroxy acid dehydrogenase/malonic semialdehyde reductase